MSEKPNEPGEEKKPLNFSFPSDSSSTPLIGGRAKEKRRNQNQNGDFNNGVPSNEISKQIKGEIKSK